MKQMFIMANLAILISSCSNQNLSRDFLEILSGKHTQNEQERQNEKRRQEEAQKRQEQAQKEIEETIAKLTPDVDNKTIETLLKDRSINVKIATIEFILKNNKFEFTKGLSISTFLDEHYNNMTKEQFVKYENIINNHFSKYIETIINDIKYEESEIKKLMDTIKHRGIDETIDNNLRNKFKASNINNMLYNFVPTSGIEYDRKIRKDMIKSDIKRYFDYNETKNPILEEKLAVLEYGTSCINTINNKIKEIKILAEKLWNEKKEKLKNDAELSIINKLEDLKQSILIEISNIKFKDIRNIKFKDIRNNNYQLTATAEYININNSIEYNSQGVGYKIKNLENLKTDRENVKSKLKEITTEIRKSFEEKKEKLKKDAELLIIEDLKQSILLKISNIKYNEDILNNNYQLTAKEYEIDKSIESNLQYIDDEIKDLENLRTDRENVKIKLKEITIEIRKSFEEKKEKLKKDAELLIINKLEDLKQSILLKISNIKYDEDILNNYYQLTAKEYEIDKSIKSNSQYIDYEIKDLENLRTDRENVKIKLKEITTEIIKSFEEKKEKLKKDAMIIATNIHLEREKKEKEDAEKRRIEEIKAKEKAIEDFWKSLTYQKTPREGSVYLSSLGNLEINNMQHLVQEALKYSSEMVGGTTKVFVCLFENLSGKTITAFKGELTLYDEFNKVKEKRKINTITGSFESAEKIIIPVYYDDVTEKQFKNKTLCTTITNKLDDLGGILTKSPYKNKAIFKVSDIKYAE